MYEKKTVIWPKKSHRSSLLYKSFNKNKEAAQPARDVISDDIRALRQADPSLGVTAKIQQSRKGKGSGASAQLHDVKSTAKSVLA